MIAKISKGARTHGVLAYLYGPGKANEHTDPHLVASWDGFAPDPGRHPDATTSQLARALDLRVKQAGTKAPEKHVWHCSVRAHPTDPILTDDQWAEVARRIVAAVGIAPEDDPDGCRWAAVRHADDHIHIVATRVRGDLRESRNWYDYPRAEKACAAIEKEWGLFEVDRTDRTAAKRTTRPEQEKATRRGLQRPARDQLREHIRRALAGAATEEEFFRRLTSEGVRIKKRITPSGDTLGYSVALIGDRNRDQQPVWFSGSKLAPDLSLPQIRKRLTDSNLPSDPESGSAPQPRARPANARRTATMSTAQALSVLHGKDDEAAAAQLVGVGEVIDALAKTSAPGTHAELREAARSFERATRSHIRAEHAHNRAIRQAAREIVYVGGALGKGEDGGTTAMVLDALILLAIAASHWHAARGHAQQAAASRQAAQHLRAAYQAAAETPLATMRNHGQQLPAYIRSHHAATLRAVLPDHADRIQTEPNWPALAATLADAQAAGHNPAKLLHRAVEERELDTADSLSDVLIWRLRSHADLPTHSPAPQRAKRSSTSKAIAQPSTYQPPAPPTTPRSRGR